MLEKLEIWKRSICAYLDECLSGRVKMLEAVNRLGPDAAERLLTFAKSGKMLRGGLVCLGYSLFQPNPDERVFAAASAVELFQSALLVHDDIMDKDATRRGMPAVHVQYADLARSSGSTDPRHVGEALAICAGDIAFFLAFDILSEIPDEQGRVAAAARRLIGLCARELTLVGVAQMADVLRGSSPSGGSSLDETLQVYLYKTGRYTFSLPLALGATLGAADEAVIGTLESVGEKLGVLFQIKDDEIGLFGDAEELGKPIGSDIQEGKKTLYHGYLMQSADPETRARLSGVFGANDLSQADIDYVRRTIRELGVDSRVREVAARYAEEARSLIDGLPDLRPEGHELLSALLEYNLSRRR